MRLAPIKENQGLLPRPTALAPRGLQRADHSQRSSTLSTSASAINGAFNNQEAGVLFRRIRQVSNLSLMEAAQRLHTFPSVIDALENGDYDRLPPWPETVLVVSGFTALAGIDPRPVLAAIREGLDAKVIDAQVLDTKPVHLAANGFQPANGASRPLQAAVPAQNRPPSALLTQANAVRPKKAIPTLAKVQENRKTPARLQRTLPQASVAWQQIVQLAASLTTHLSQRLSPVIARIPPLPLTSRIAPRWRLPIAGCLIMMSLPLTGIVSFGGLNPLNAAVSSLPAPISGFFRSVEDYVLRSTATHKNGLMWIEVSDPRTRKTDKLPSPRR